MWCVQRQQNSYTSGTYRDRYFAHPDNQKRLWFGLNSITEKFWYNNEIDKTMRLIVSAPTDNPLVWYVTKVENTKPIGIQKLTLYQAFFNEHTDYIERDESGRIIAMYADYWDDNKSIEPVEEKATSIIPPIYGEIIATTSKIKVGGSYKTLSLKILNGTEDITERYSNSIIKWTCSIDGKDLTDKVIWRNGTGFNQIKIKFPDERKYLGGILEIKCIISDLLEPITALFELTI